MHWLYVVLPADVGPLPRQGAGGAPLAQLQRRGVQVVYEPCARPPSASRTLLLAFGEVVQSLCAWTEALPFRFGSTVSGEEELATLIEKRAGEWLARLSSLRGQAEFMVHVRSLDSARRVGGNGDTESQPPVTPSGSLRMQAVVEGALDSARAERGPARAERGGAGAERGGAGAPPFRSSGVETAGSGKRFLLARAEAFRRGQHLGESLREALAPACTELRVLVAPLGEARLACLAPHEARPRLEATVNAWSQAHLEARSWMTGPWPPFSFTQGAPPP